MQRESQLILTLNSFYQTFKEYTPQPAQTQITEKRAKTRARISLLSGPELVDMCVDVNDELQRRMQQESPFLQANENHTPSKNKSRKDLSRIPAKGFSLLVGDLAGEIETRYPIVIDNYNDRQRGKELRLSAVADGARSLSPVDNSGIDNTGVDKIVDNSGVISPVAINPVVNNPIKSNAGSLHALNEARSPSPRPTSPFRRPSSDIPKSVHESTIKEYIQLIESQQTRITLLEAQARTHAETVLKHTRLLADMQQLEREYEAVCVQLLQRDVSDASVQTDYIQLDTPRTTPEPIEDKIEDRIESIEDKVESIEDKKSKTTPELQITLIKEFKALVESNAPFDQILNKTSLLISSLKPEGQNARFDIAQQEFERVLEKYTERDATELKEKAQGMVQSVLSLDTLTQQYSAALARLLNGGDMTGVRETVELLATPMYKNTLQHKLNDVQTSLMQNKNVTESTKALTQTVFASTAHSRFTLALTDLRMQNISQHDLLLRVKAVVLACRDLNVSNETRLEQTLTDLVHACRRGAKIDVYLDALHIAVNGCDLRQELTGLLTDIQDGDRKRLVSSLSRLSRIVVADFELSRRVLLVVHLLKDFLKGGDPIDPAVLDLIAYIDSNDHINDSIYNQSNDSYQSYDSINNQRNDSINNQRNDSINLSLESQTHDIVLSIQSLLSLVRQDTFSPDAGINCVSDINRIVNDVCLLVKDFQSKEIDGICEIARDCVDELHLVFVDEDLAVVRQRVTGVCFNLAKQIKALVSIGG